MNTKYILGIVAVTFLMAACKKDLEPQESTPADSSAVAENAAVQTPANAAPMTQNAVPMGSAAQPMNPAHGQPGHRCDIAVGAPLNSTAKNAAPSNTTPVAPTPQQSMTVSTPQQATPAKVAAGMNPAHGQPGHRCDIAVGAPLNSPAGKTPTPTQTITKTAPPTTTAVNTTPTLLQGNTPVAATAPGMNPAHGQAGHRCDIAVGAALPKS